MLKTETDTPVMERRVLEAAHAVLGRKHKRHRRAMRPGEQCPTTARRLSADFEHGQWWVTDLDSGEQWSVVDATGGRSVDGFDFEQVTQGDDDE